MKHFLLTLLVMCLPAYAEVNLDDYRRMIDTENFEELEKSIAGLHQNSLNTGESSDLRKIYGTLFQTTHPERRKAIDKWVKAYPVSPYANAAAAWMYVRSGWLYRGERTVSGTSNEAMQAFELHMNKANAYTLTAYEKLPEFLPANDAVFLMQRIGKQNRDPYPVLEVVLQSIPNSSSVIKAAAVLSPFWGGSQRKQDRLCEIYAERVENYNAEICKVQLFFPRYGGTYYVTIAPQSERDWAESTVEKYSDAPELEYWAYIVSFNKDRSEENLQKLKTLHLEQNFGIHNTENYIGNAHFYARAFKDVDIIIQSYLNLKKVADEQLIDDPFAYDWLDISIRHELEFRHLDLYTGINVGETKLSDDQLNNLRLKWYKAMHYGRFDSDMWRLGGNLATARTDSNDLASKQIFTQNRLYYAKHNLDTVSSYLGEILGTHKYAMVPRQSWNKNPMKPEDVLRTATCDIVRAVRIIKFQCGWQSAASCLGENYDGQNFIQAKEITSKTTQCLHEQRMPLDSVLYDPVPFNEINFKSMGWPEK